MNLRDIIVKYDDEVKEIEDNLREVKVIFFLFFMTFLFFLVVPLSF